MDNSFQFMMCSKCGELLTMREMLSNHHTDDEGIMHPLCSKCEEKMRNNKIIKYKE